MNETRLAAVRDALVAARRSARAIDPYPAEWLPADLAEAYRLQSEVAQALGAVRGWKVVGVTPEQRRALGVDRPLGGPMLAPWMRDATAGEASFRVAEFIVPKLECELGFEFARDLPPRPDRPYARDEVEAAIGALRLGIEIVDSRLPPGRGGLAELADACNNGGYVAGPSIRDWRSLAFAELGIVLHRSHEGRTAEIARGSGAAILEGDPFAAVVMLANAQPLGSGGLRQGTIVTTGSCTGAPALPGPGRYRADFGRLGGVDVRFDGDA
jgi:2-keto-4-pentenoate hydratase